MKRTQIVSFTAVILSVACFYSLVVQAKIDNFNSLIQQQVEQEKQTYNSITQKDPSPATKAAISKNGKKLLVIKASQKQYVVSEDADKAAEGSMSSPKKSNRAPASDSTAIYQKIGEELNDSN